MFEGLMAAFAAATIWTSAVTGALLDMPDVLSARGAITLSADAIPLSVSTGLIGGESEGVPSGSVGGICAVRIVRTGKSGDFEVTRSVAKGACTCTVTSGPEGSSDSADAAIAALLSERKCDGAKLVDSVKSGTSSFAPFGLGIAALGAAAPIAKNRSAG